MMENTSPEILILKSASEILEAIEYLTAHKSPYLVFDFETDSAQEKLAQVWGLGLLADEKEAFYLPFRGPDKSYLHSEEDEAAILDALHKLFNSKKLIGHNSLYDFLVMENNWGVDLSDRLYADTILMKHMVDEERPFGLKDVAVKYLGDWANKSQQRMIDNIKAKGGRATKEHMDMWLTDTAILGEYCCYDVYLTFRLFTLFEGRIKSEGLAKLFYDEEVMPLYREVTIPMKRHGFHVNMEHFERLKQELTTEIKKLEDSINEDISELVPEFEEQLIKDGLTITHRSEAGKALLEAGIAHIEETSTEVPGVTKKKQKDGTVLETPCIKTKVEKTLIWDYTPASRAILKTLFCEKNERDHIFNLNSTAHLSWLFFTKLEIKPTEFTDSGAPSMGAEELDKLSGQHPFADKIIDFKKLGKLKSTYVEGILDRQIDGIIYTSFLQFGTTSGRFSATNPNIQNLPRVKDEEAELSPIVLKYVNSIKKGFVSPPGYSLIGNDYCLPMHTEYLTQSGWKTVDALSSDDQVWQVDPVTLYGSFTTPSRIINREFTGTMYKFTSPRGDMEMTENHRMLWVGQQTHKRADKARYRVKSLAQDGIPTSGCAVACFTYSGSTSNYSDHEIWMACMTQADGSRVKKQYRIQVSVGKKRNKIRELLGRGGTVLPPRGAQTLDTEKWTYYFESPLLCQGKEKEFDLSSLGANQIETFIEALAFWDGSTYASGRMNYYTTSLHNAEEVQRYCTRSGYEATYLRDSNLEKVNSRRCYTLSIKIKGTVRFGVHKSHLSSIEVQQRQVSTRVGCVTVPTGYIFVRQNGFSFVTGNCQLEPTAVAEATGDVLFQNVFKTGLDLYSYVAIVSEGLEGQYSADKKAPNFLKNDKKGAALRTTYKTLTLATIYGASAYRLSFTLGCSVEEAQAIVNRYLGAFPGIKEYIESCHSLAKNKGIAITRFGRIRHLPDVKHLYQMYGDELLNSRWAKKKGLEDQRKRFKNLLNLSTNHPAQGIAAHIVNRAMIAISRRFKMEKIDGCIIAMVHDEVVCSVKDEHLERASAIIQDCMENTVKLSVPLSAVPAIGKTWDEAK